VLQSDGTEERAERLALDARDEFAVVAGFLERVDRSPAQESANQLGTSRWMAKQAGAHICEAAARGWCLCWEGGVKGVGRGVEIEVRLRAVGLPLRLLTSLTGARAAAG
jgi:hypothetical protein